MVKMNDKFQLYALKWDSTKDSTKTERFRDDMHSLVVQLPNDDWLEAFLDHKCHHNRKRTHATWMESNDFERRQDGSLGGNSTQSANPNRADDGSDPGDEEPDRLAAVTGNADSARPPVRDFIKSVVHRVH